MENIIIQSDIQHNPLGTFLSIITDLDSHKGNTCMVVFTCIAVAVTEVVHFYMCTCFKSKGENEESKKKIETCHKPANKTTFPPSDFSE